MENFKIDDQNRLYIFPHEEIKESEKLKTECLDFVRKSLTFDESIQLLVKKLGDLSLVVETQKLKALAEKSKLEHANERKIKKKEGNLIIYEESRLKSLMDWQCFKASSIIRNKTLLNIG